MGFMFFFSILLLIAVNVILGLRTPTRNLLDLVITQFLLACGQIVLIFEAASLLGVLSQPIAFIVIQGVLLCGALIFWFFTRHFAALAPASIPHSLQQFGRFLQKNKVFTLYALVLLAIYIGVAALSISYPQTTSDSLYNHLSRIGHWLQQGSLKPYSSFSDFAVTYPYNNSLLMMWSVLFLKDDLLVGLTQWFSAFALSASIYGLGLELHFEKKPSAYAALIFLTFPIVILEAGTAQNDLLAAAFFLCATWLTIYGLRHQSKMHLVYAGLALGLAIGTKQYVLYALPGLLAQAIYMVRKEKLVGMWSRLRVWFLSIAIFTVFVGGYAYLQNFISFGNFFVKTETNILAPIKTPTLPAKLAYNTSRMITQFISCDGLPIPWESTCREVKENLLSGFFSALHFDLRNKVYLLEEDCGELCFNYGGKYPLNEESAWFGPLSWILIFLGTIVVLIRSLKRKDALPLILLLSALFFFAVTSVFKTGWDPYLGRYLMLSTALVTPFIAVFLDETKLWQKPITWVILLVSLMLASFSILTNTSRPIVNESYLDMTHQWGRDHHMILVSKVAYKLKPYFPVGRSYTEFTNEDIKNRIDPGMNQYLQLVNSKTDPDSRLAIVTTPQIFMDYYLFGDHFTRELYEFPAENNLPQIYAQLNELSLNTLLISNNLAQEDPPPNFELISQNDSWSIYQRK